MTDSNNLVIPPTDIYFLLYNNIPCPESMFSASLPSASSSGIISESFEELEEEQETKRANAKKINIAECFFIE